ncbi:alpha/beta fold hydrolase [Draconibacterium sp.]|jgi:pimeloyl-ACP methyl ester carboxylesterase
MIDTVKELNIKVNGLNVSYIDEGRKNAPVIVFVHGFPFNKWMWKKQIKAFKKDFRVIAYDIRGFGNSEKGNVHFSVQLFGFDLIGLMDALHIEKAVLCGLSMGGYIAFSVMENFQHRFSKLVLCDTKCAGDDVEAKEKRMQTIESIKQNGKSKYAEESLWKLFSQSSFVSNPEAIEQVREMILATPDEVLFQSLIALAERHDNCSLLSTTNLPVLIIVGEDDKLTPPDIARQMDEKIPDSDLFIIENAGHLSPMEQPEEFNRLLKSFLRD